MEKIEVRKNIFLIKFPSQEELASTFLRFQEHYESPEFQGKIFTFDEYKDWYTKLKGKFSYYTDWGGFNIPSHILKPFREGKFDPLSEQEKGLLNLFEGSEHPFYIIGLFKDQEDKKVLHTLKHEIAHGLFYTEPEYRDKTLKILSKYNLDALKGWLRALGGYNESVIEDECHAFAITGSSKLTVEVPDGLSKELNALYELYAENSG